MAKTKDLSPFRDLMPLIMAYLKQRQGGLGPQAYPGALRAGWSPQIEMSRSLMQQRAAGGQPQGWQKAGNFADNYSGGYNSGVFNPMTGQTEHPDVRSLGQGGMPPGGGMGMGGGGMQGPPPGGGGPNRMDMGGGPQQQPMNPQLMMLIQALMGGGGQGGGGGGMNDRMPFVAFGRPTDTAPNSGR